MTSTLVCVLVGILISMRMLSGSGLSLAFSDTAHTSRNGLENHLTCAMSDPRMNPTHEIYHGQDVIWQIPPEPKAVLFLAHGMNGNPFVFFDPGPGCEQCLGTPETRNIVLDALERSYAVIASKSITNLWDTWPIDTSEDLEIVTSLVENWTRQHSLDGLPVTAWGFSRGGDLVTSLPFTLRVKALVVMCSKGTQEAEELAIPRQFPSTFFVHMAKDVQNVQAVHRSMGILEGRGVSTTEKLCYPVPLSPLFFAERILCLEDHTSRMLYEAFENAGWLDGDGYLNRSPIDGNWKAVLSRSDQLLPSCQVLDESQCPTAAKILQELLWAYGFHTWTGDSNDVIFEWLDFQLSTHTPTGHSLF